jgi:crossover junction endodeoxyribonuclease RusA
MTLPWPPSVNSYWRHPTKGPLAGRHLVSEEGRAYRNAVTVHALHIGRKNHLTGRLSIEVIASPPDRRRRDLDNILKALLDSIAHAGLIKDDSQFDKILVMREPPSPDGAVKIKITQLENP